MDKCNGQMLRSLEENQKSQWKEHLNPLTHAYNCKQNSDTGFSPFFLIFGQQIRIPLDLILGNKISMPQKTRTIPQEMEGDNPRTLTDSKRYLR